MTITLRDLLNDGKVHVLDGAMGTMLYAKGFFLNVCYDELSVKQPKLVQEVHEAYVRAGAEILETNTFGANPVKLRTYGLADDTEHINRTAAELARKASLGRASVVGAIGPLGVRLEPFGALSREEAFAHFQRQVQGLVAGEVDGFILETFSDVDEIHQALRAVQSVSTLPVIAQMTIGDDGLTHYGTAPETFAQQLAEWGADVIGVNCSVGPAGVLEAVEKLVKATDRPISAVPNAGLPKDVGDRKTYLASPEDMASYARRMSQARGRIVGGSWGTTPGRITQTREYRATAAPRRATGAGLRNILIITGDPPKMGPSPEATAVFDIDSIGLTNLVYRLNHGLDPGNNPIGGPTSWAIGVGVNPGAVELDRELSRFHWKVDAGAEFAVTQPVFDVRQLESFLKRVDAYRIPIVAGIWPLVSLRNAEFLANEVPGVVVPAEVLDRMRRAQDKGKEAALAEGVKIAREMFQQVKGSVQGVQVSAPFGRVEVALEVFG